MPDIIAPSVPTGLTATLTTGYTLTGSAASFTITAPAIVIAASGSYTLTGTAAALAMPQVFPAAAGSYTLTGSAATFATSSHFALAAAAGNYGLSGADAAFRIATTTGYVLTGQGATLRLTQSLGASNYTLTGGAATIAVMASLPANGGIYSISGRMAGFVTSSNVTLVCDSGAYTLTGSPATLLGAELPPEVVAPSPGGAGAGRRYGRYGRWRLKKKYRDELEELFDRIQALPPPAAEAEPPLTGKTAVNSLLSTGKPPSPSTSLLDGVAAPVLTTLQPSASAQDEDDDEVAVLLELLS